MKMKVHNKIISTTILHFLKQIIFFVIIPLIITHIYINYLLKDGYAGYIDNGALALPLNKYFELLIQKDGWWFGPGMLIPTLIYIFVKDKVLAWKFSIYIYHLLAFLVSYYSFKNLYVILFNHKNKCHKYYFPIIFYLLAIGYTFSVFIKEAGRNYFLPQFTVPYIFEPLYLLLVIKLFKDCYVNTCIKKSKTKILLLATIVGWFVCSNPPIVVANILFMTFLLIILIFDYYLRRENINNKNILSLVAYYILIVFMSTFVVIYSFFISGESKIYEKHGIVKKILWSLPMIYVLTASTPQISINDQFSFIYPYNDLIIPSSILYYLPLTIAFYIGLILLKKEKSEFYNKVYFSLSISLLLISLFMHGETADDMLAHITKQIIKPITPAFIYNSFYNKITNLVISFTYYYIGMVILIYYTINKNKYKLKYILISLLIIIFPIVMYYYLIHNIFSQLVNPTPIPEEYKELFNFIKEHNDTYLWIPCGGILKWRGVFMSNIPGYLSEYYDVEMKYLIGKSYYTIIYSLAKNNYTSLAKYNVSYIIILKDDIIGRYGKGKLGYPLNKVVQIIESNDRVFKLVKQYGKVKIYKVIYN